MIGGRNEMPGDFLLNSAAIVPEAVSILNEMKLFQNSLGGPFLMQSSKKDSGSEKFPSPDSGLFGPKTFKSSPNFKENENPSFQTMPAQRLSFGTKTLPSFAQIEENEFEIIRQM